MCHVDIIKHVKMSNDLFQQYLPRPLRWVDILSSSVLCKNDEILYTLSTLRLLPYFYSYHRSLIIVPVSWEVSPAF